MLSDVELSEVEKRIGRGETLRPSAARMEAARALLLGEKPPPNRSLSPAERGALVAACMVLTPFCALAVAWAYREAPAGRQAAIVGVATLVFDVGLAIAAMAS